MLGFLKGLFRKPEPRPEFSQEEQDRYYEAKKLALEKMLGPMHGLVGHAIIPFCLGGSVDMYYFMEGIEGTAAATMELIEPDGKGPQPNRIGTYELVSFTRLSKPLTQDDSDANDPFAKIERRLCGTMTMVGRYSYEAVLNPGETCELPSDNGQPNQCLVLDEYDPHGTGFVIDGHKHCLLLCIEVFRSEMEYARECGSALLLDKLKAAGHYPYSDLDREPVV